jgi:poly-gamma-glutamate synthesis protein (capsule biosynthesis protein)
MPRQTTVTLGAVGDIGFYGRCGQDMLDRGLDWPFERMLPHLLRADLLYGNMESVCIPPDYPKKRIDPAGLVSQLTGPDAADALVHGGFDFLNLAANHVLDAGSVGMFHTRKTLEDAGLETAGVGKTQKEARKMRVVELNGIRFGFLCYCEDSNYTLGTTGPCYAYYTRDAVLEDVRKNRRKCDVLVVSIHGDIEFMPTPSAPRLASSRAIAKAGADIILEHHPHVPQGIERVGRSLIAYSLGNFIFPAHTSGYMKGNAPHTGHSFLLLVKVGKGGVRSFERVPFVIKGPPEQRPWPLAGAARRKLLKYFATLDAHLKDAEFVKRTWREVAKRHLAIYIKRAAERDLDSVISELVGRLVFTAENRSWMEEILVMGREEWEKQRREIDPLHRPHYRYSKRSGKGR